MKLKYFVVEHIDYLSNGNGFPSAELDDRTFRRRQFKTKKEAKSYVKNFLMDDPGYVGMWLARISIHKITEKVAIKIFNPKGYKNGIEPFSFQVREEPREPEEATPQPFKE